MLFNQTLQVHHVECLRKMKLSLSELWTIEQYIVGNKVECREVKELEKKYYIKDDALTALGRNVYEALTTMEKPEDTGKKKQVVKIKTQYDEQWNKFWSNWPSTNGFTWKGRTFESTRAMKSAEEKCKILYIRILEEDKTDPDILLKSANAMFTTKMEESYTKNKNEVQYLNGMDVWLRNKVYKAWMNVTVKQDKQEKDTSIDI